MPAIMMMPASGVLDSVTGSSSAMAEMGPIPGSTPTSVPMNTPKKHASKLESFSATPKPSARLVRMSIGGLLLRQPGRQDAHRHLDLQPMRDRVIDAAR